jgi:CHAT domain-containing protein
MKPKLESALGRMGEDQLLGQVVLFDRMLLYRATSHGVVWKQVFIRKDDVLGAAEPLERAVSSAATPMSVVEKAARRAGDLFLGQFDGDESAGGRKLLLEPDPLLGNFPWPAVETAAGPLGLHFNLEESPSLLLGGDALRRAGGKPLVVGASIAGEEHQWLPEVVEEARAVVRFSDDGTLLLGQEASQAHVAARMATASAIHFAGHAAQEEGATRLLLAPANSGPMVEGSRGNGEIDRSWLDSSLLRKYPPREARLVVFSACATGRKDAGWNHGMGDIVATLGGMGVPDVVATRWQIDSESAVPMMDGFYNGLASGMAVPQALTAARQGLVRDARYRHPYYWAAWYASGFGRSDLRAMFHGRS